MGCCAVAMGCCECLPGAKELGGSLCGIPKGSGEDLRTLAARSGRGRRRGRREGEHPGRLEGVPGVHCRRRLGRGCGLLLPAPNEHHDVTQGKPCKRSA